MSPQRALSPIAADLERILAARRVADRLHRHMLRLSDRRRRANRKGPAWSHFLRLPTQSIVSVCEDC